MNLTILIYGLSGIGNAEETAQEPVDAITEAPEAEPAEIVEEPAAESVDTTASLRRDRPGHFAVTAGTRFPLTAGVGLQLELPGRLQLSAGAGQIPESYVDSLSTVVIDATGVDSIYGIGAAALFSNAPYTHLGVGFRPGKHLVLSGGYQVLRLGTSSDELSLDGVNLGSLGISTVAEVDTTVRMLTAEIRYDAFIGDRFLLSMGLGGARTLSAQTDITLSQETNLAAVDEAIQLAEGEMDALYETWFQTPTVGISLGYRFF